MKTCSAAGCNNPVWSKGVCLRHTPKSPLKVNPKVARDFLSCIRNSKVIGPEKRNEFFMTIWNSRPHMCQHCGASLGREPRSYMFDHILEKSKHPELFLEPENIWLVCFECHDNKSRGIISEKYREKINFVITKFNEA